MSTPTKTRNKAAQQAFEKFIWLLENEERVKDAVISAPLLNEHGLFDGKFPGLEMAREWFEIVEPLLYEYMLRFESAKIEGKALIIAKGITAASYSAQVNSEQAYRRYLRTGEIGEGEYKLLPQKMAVARWNSRTQNRVEIGGVTYEDWIEAKDVFEAAGLQVEKRIQMAPENLDAEDGPMTPGLSYERILEAVERWDALCATAPGRKRGRSVAENLSRAQVASKVRMTQMQVRLAKAQERRKLLETQPNLKDPMIVCAANTRIRLRNASPLNEFNRVQITRMPERAKLQGKKLKSSHAVGVRMVDVKREWMFTGQRYGVLLDQIEEGDGLVYQAPEEDFPFPAQVFEGEVYAWSDHTSKHNAPYTKGRRGLGRLTLPGEIVNNLLERRYREQPLGYTELVKRMQPKYGTGEAPKLYYLGPRTGNLYPAKFIRKAKFLKAALPERLKDSEYAKYLTKEAVLALLLKEPPYTLFETFDLPYRFPERMMQGRDERLIVCLEDELVNVLPDEERMVRADLHRYLELLGA